MAQLKEGSVIKKSTGDEVIATKKYVDDKVVSSVGGTKIISSPTEPTGLQTGDYWHKEI